MAALTIQFPRAKKRGAKVRRGPCADVLQFPKQLAGDELRGRWAWLSRNHRCWTIEDPDGMYEDPKDWDSIVRVCGEAYAGVFGQEFNDRTMRRDVTAWKAVIEKRNLLKDWLDDQGINWSTAKSPQDALEFLYDRIRAQPLTPCA